MMCWKSSTKLGSTPKDARGVQGGYFFGCSPCPVVAADCALQWQRDLGTIPPPLLAYDNGSGGVTVLPRDIKPPAGYERLPGRSQDVALIQLQQSLDDYVNGLNSRCLDSTAATSLASMCSPSPSPTMSGTSCRAPTSRSGSSRWSTATA